MCGGAIVAPAGKHGEAVRRFGLIEFLKRFWKKITFFYPVGELYQSKVNMCLKCGDLEIDENWLNISHISKSRISEAIKSGSIIINGMFKVCFLCSSKEKKTGQEQGSIFSHLGFQLE
ncbi:MAG: hypothetical protein AAB688_00175 [Patescibacteria group bacterium]